MPVVVYNGFTVPNPIGKFFFTHDYNSMTFRTNFLVKGTSAANLVSLCNTVESNLREPYENLTVSFGGEPEYSFNHDSNTGLLTQPKVTKIQNDVSLEISRMYSFEFSCQLPADKSGFDFRRDASFTITTGIDSRKTVTFNFTYTASPAPSLASSRDNFDSFAVGFANTILADIGGTFYQTEISSDTEHEEKITTGRLVYKEILNTIVPTYNSTVIPNTYGPFFFSQNYEKMNFRCNFLIIGVSSLDLISKAAAIEAACREPWSDFTVSFDANTEYTFNQSDNTGLNTWPKITVLEGDKQSTTERAYQFDLECNLPADKATYDFRRSASFEISTDRSHRRLVAFELVYTASPGAPAQSSRENFDTFAEPYAVSILTAIGGKYERISIRSNTEHNEKITRGNISYQEVLDDETKGTFNDTDIIDATCDFSVDFWQDVGVSNTSEFVQDVPLIVSLDYSTRINKDTVNVEDIEEKYRQDIRPWLIEHSFDVLGLDNYDQAGTSYIIKNDRFRINNYTFTISGNLTFIAPRTLSSVIELSESITETLNEGIVLRKLWNGIPFNHAKWELGASKFINRVIRVKQLGVVPAPPTPLTGNNIRLNATNQGEVRTEGIGTATFAGETVQINVFENVFTEQYAFVLNFGDFSGIEGPG